MKFLTNLLFLFSFLWLPEILGSQMFDEVVFILYAIVMYTVNEWGIINSILPLFLSRVDRDKRVRAASSKMNLKKTFKNIKLANKKN